jgi:hypothetical protein
MTVTTQDGRQHLKVPECVHCEVEWMPRSLLEPDGERWVPFQRTESVLAEVRHHGRPEG